MNTNKSNFRKVDTASNSAQPSSFVPLRAPSWTILFALALTTLGCRKSDMGEQPRYKPYQATMSFDNGASARPLVAGTVPRGQARTDELLYQGTVTVADASGTHTVAANEFPFPITGTDLVRGRQQFNIFCSACHGQTGEGNGMIAQRGLTPPPSYHIARLRSAPVGHFFLMITNGQGAMYGYADRIKPEDRWRIAAYIRALQLSQNAKPSDLTDDQKTQADAAPSVSPKELLGYTGPRGKVGVDQ